MKPSTKSDRDEIASKSNARRESWAHILAVTENDSIPTLEKLEKCDHIASIYAALTGDDSMVRPELRSARDGMVSGIDLKMDRAKQSAKDRAKGQISIFDLLK